VTTEPVSAPARRERRSISQSISLTVTTATALVTVLALAILLAEAWRRYDENLRRRATSTMGFLVESLQIPLWSLDTEATASIASAVARDEVVGRLEVTGARGEVYFQEAKPGEIALERSATVSHDGLAVGEVRLAVSAEPRRRFLWSVGLVAGVTGILVIGAELLLIGPLLRSRLRAPFESLDSTIRSYLAGRYDAPPLDVAYSEFEPLTDVLWRMGQTVEQQMRELRAAESKYRRIFENARVGIFQTTPEGQIVDVNPAWVDFLGYRDREEAIARIKDVETQVYADPADRRVILEELRREGHVVRREVRMRRRDGSLMWGSITAEAVRGPDGGLVLIEGITDDVTEHRRMQELMIQAEKMISVGGLAAGMAHELNNPLGIILNATQNLERRFSPDLARNREEALTAGVDLEAVGRYMARRGIPAYLASIREAAERAARIIRTMLEFSRTGGPQRAACSLRQIAETALELAANDYDLKRKVDFRLVQIVRDLDPQTPLVDCTPTELVQVVFNIVRNAAEALAEAPEGHDGPTITVRTRAEGEFARLEIRDNGPGMDERTRRRVFEPYFSTKGPGGGTGLGLSVVYFIVTQRHGGTITVESAPGEGTEFVIRLPARGPDAAGTPAASPPVPVPPSSPFEG
jgi:PAS domain S-box-containing protein